MALPIHIGTSGWSYNHWRELWYPRGLAASKWLPYYAERFDVTEINASFYRLPSQDTVLRWIEQVPPHFQFCPKMSRFLTHMKKLRQPEEPLQRFFSIFDAMHGRLGPVLLQLPAMLAFRPEVAEYLYALMEEGYSQYEFVMEVRHPSWLQPESLQLMARYNIGLVISQSGDEFPYAEQITARNIYVRFHGPRELYASPYDDEMLEAFAAKFVNWARAGKVVWAFFNNDIHGYAPVDAKRLVERVKSKEQ